MFVIVHSSFIHTSIRFYLYFTQISFIFSSYFIYVSFIENEGPRKIQRQPLQYPPLLGPGWNYRTSPLSVEKLGPKRGWIRSIGAFLGLNLKNSRKCREFFHLKWRIFKKKSWSLLRKCCVEARAD